MSVARVFGFTRNFSHSGRVSQASSLIFMMLCLRRVIGPFTARDQHCPVTAVVTKQRINVNWWL